MKKVSKNIKGFLLLSNVYYERLMGGKSVSELASQLSTEECIYLYNKHVKSEDLKDKTGFIEKDSDIEDNWYALSYAASKYLNTLSTGHKVFDNYILKMAKRD